MVEEGGTIEWVSGSFGSHVSYLYPMSILKGKGARMEFTGITFAGKGQNLDTGAKVVHSGAGYFLLYEYHVPFPRTAVSAPSEAPWWSPRMRRTASAAVSCQSLMLDDHFPVGYDPGHGHPHPRCRCGP